MKAEELYQTDVKMAVPLTFWSKNDVTEGLSAYEHTYLQSFQALAGEVSIVPDSEGRPCRVFIGLGDGDRARALATAVLRLPVGVYLAPPDLDKFALMAWALAQYRFDQYKKKPIEKRVLAVSEAMFESIQLETQAIFLVRDLINKPANELNPAEMAEQLASIAHEHKAVFKQWCGEELIQDNFPAIHAVGRASSSAPRLLSLTWGDKSHPKVTLIGKGVCFDSGGLDIKPAQNMRLMKKDMGGAAQVMGLAQWLMAYQLPIRLEVWIPAVENAIGSDAFRPGDVLTMRNGLTVEIDNTDAEGRLILADALAKACEEKPDILIDFATLTGAARVAVGTEISAMFCNDDVVADALLQSGRDEKDPVWRMPLYEGYNSMLESTVADLVNSTPSSYAGAITAALFLQRFIDTSVAWVHFDVMAWNVGSKPGRPEGGEAMGMLATGRYLIQRFSKDN